MNQTQNLTQKAKNLKQVQRQNILESLRDIGGSFGKSVKEDLVQGASDEFAQQLFGYQNRTKKYSGEIDPGNPLNISDVYSEKYQENQRLQKQLAFERRLREEEKLLIERRGQELRIQLQAIMQEVNQLAKSTQTLSTEIEIAAVQAPTNPGVYHVVFFEKLIAYIASYRKNVDGAIVWLQASNKRAQKRTFWGSYKKHGGSFLLSPDHYLQRSAG